MSSLAQISRVKHVFKRDTLVTIINALVFSKLFYCSSLGKKHLQVAIGPELCRPHHHRYEEIRPYHASTERSTLASY